MYAEPRFTKDLDLIVAPRPQNATRVLKALEEFGAPTANLTRKDLVRPGLLYVFGVPPLRVDILNRIEGIELKAVIKKANRVAIDDTHIRVVAIEDLIAMKLLAGRPQDKADVAALKRAIRKRQA